MDAHDKADTLHRDVALGNIILYEDADVTSRVGYLIDWELSHKAKGVPIDTFNLTVCRTPIMFTIISHVGPGDFCFHVLRCLEWERRFL